MKKGRRRKTLAGNSVLLQMQMTAETFLLLFALAVIEKEEKTNLLAGIIAMIDP